MCGSWTAGLQRWDKSSWSWRQYGSGHRGKLRRRSQKRWSAFAAESGSMRGSIRWSTLEKADALGRAAAGLGTLARIKPVVTISPEGAVQVAGKCMGKARAMKEILGLTEKVQPDPNYPIYGVYSGSQEAALELAAKLAEQGIELPPEQIFGLGPVIGAHIGPGAYGIVYIAKE